MSIYDMSWAQINKPRPWKLYRLRVWLWMCMFERAIHSGNRCYELKMDTKISRLKCRVLKLQIAHDVLN